MSMIFQSKHMTPCVGVLSAVKTATGPIAGTPGIGTFSETAGDTAGIGIDQRFPTPKDPTAQALHVVGAELWSVKPRLSVLAV